MEDRNQPRLSMKAFLELAPTLNQERATYLLTHLLPHLTQEQLSQVNESLQGEGAPSNEAEQILLDKLQELLPARGPQP